VIPASTAALSPFCRHPLGLTKLAPRLRPGTRPAQTVHKRDLVLQPANARFSSATRRVAPPRNLGRNRLFIRRRPFHLAEKYSLRCSLHLLPSRIEGMRYRSVASPSFGQSLPETRGVFGIAAIHFSNSGKGHCRREIPRPDTHRLPTSHIGRPKKTAGQQIGRGSRPGVLQPRLDRRRSISGQTRPLSSFITIGGCGIAFICLEAGIWLLRQGRNIAGYGVGHKTRSQTPATAMRSIVRRGQTGQGHAAGENASPQKDRIFHFIFAALSEHSLAVRFPGAHATLAGRQASGNFRARAKDLSKAW